MFEIFFSPLRRRLSSPAYLTWIPLCSRCALLLVTLLCSGLSTRPGFPWKPGGVWSVWWILDCSLWSGKHLWCFPDSEAVGFFLLPRASLARGRRRAKVRLPFPLPPEAPAAREVKVREPGRSLPDGALLPVRVGGCLSRHWRQWQAIGAETWVVTVLRDGYRVPFTASPPPPSSHTGIVSDVPGRLSSGSSLAARGRGDACQRSLRNRPRSGSRLLQSSLPGGEGDWRLEAL